MRIQQAWTLIELLIVMVILSVFMTLAIPQLSIVTQQGQKLAAQQLLLEALTAVQMRRNQTLEIACVHYYQREQSRFVALTMTLRCQEMVYGEVILSGDSKSLGFFKLSNIHGFIASE